MPIPGLILALLTLHALLIKRHRISPHPGLPTPAPDTVADLTAAAPEPPAPQSATAGEAATAEKTPLAPPTEHMVEVVTPHGDTYVERSEPFTHHPSRLGAFGLVMLGALAVVAVLLPPPVGPPPVAGIEVTKPMWPFWWMFTLENWLGLHRQGQQELLDSRRSHRARDGRALDCPPGAQRPGGGRGHSTERTGRADVGHPCGTNPGGGRAASGPEGSPPGLLSWPPTPLASACLESPARAPRRRPGR